MPLGLQAWNDDGLLIFDTSDRISREIGSVAITTAAGSLTNAAFGTGEPYAVLMTSASNYERSGHVISFSGNTMSWTSGNFSGFIRYGVY